MRKIQKVSKERQQTIKKLKGLQLIHNISIVFIIASVVYQALRIDFFMGFAWGFIPLVLWEAYRFLKKTRDIIKLIYWLENAEEDYMNTPISVLRYIAELEKVLGIRKKIN